MSKLENEILFDNNYPKLHNQTAARLVFVLEDIPGKLLLTKYHGFMCYDCMRDDGLLYNINPDETYMLLLFVGNENIMFSTFRKQNKENVELYAESVGDVFILKIRE